MIHRPLHEIRGTAHIDGEEAILDGKRHILDRPVRDDAGGIDRDVLPPQRWNRLLDDAFKLCLLRHVRCNPASFSPSRLKPTRDPLQCLASRDMDDSGSFGAELRRCRVADARHRAGNEDGLPRHLFHSSPHL